MSAIIEGVARAMPIFVPRRSQGALVNVLQGIVLGVFLTALSYIVGLRAGWIDSLDYIEVFAVFTSYVCTFLCVVERRINYPIGAVSTAAYCLLFYNSHLYASMAINGFLAVYLVYGWMRWRSDDDTRPVTRMTIPSWIVSILVAITGYIIVAGISDANGGHLAWTDSVIFIGTILAQFMLDNKKLENWHVWAIVNMFAIFTYFDAHLALAGFQYIFFLLNTVYGYFMWKRSQS